MLHQGGLDDLILNRLGLKGSPPDLRDWKAMVERVTSAPLGATIAVVGKYTHTRDAYKSIAEALIHAGVANGCRVDVRWVDAEQIEAHGAAAYLADIDGILVPGAFGERGSEGKIAAVRYAREQRVPYFGICLGMQCAVIEFARHVCGLTAANSFATTKPSRGL